MDVRIVQDQTVPDLTKTRGFYPILNGSDFDTGVRTMKGFITMALQLTWLPGDE